MGPAYWPGKDCQVPVLEAVALADHPNLAVLVRRLEPTYRKRKVFVTIAEKVTCRPRHWDEGSCDNFQHRRLNGDTVPIDYEAWRFPAPPSSTTVHLEPGHVVTNCGVFCGKPATLALYIRKDDAALVCPGLL